jgi:Lsr2
MDDMGRDLPDEAAPDPPWVDHRAQPTAREIRDWAREQGLDCPPHGPIPDDVRRAYEAAQSAG